MQAIEQDTLFDLNEVPIVAPKNDEMGSRKKQSSSADRPRHQQDSLFGALATEGELPIEADEAPSREPASKFKLNTADFDPIFATRLHDMIKNRRRIFSDELGDQTFEVIAYEKGFHWSSSGRTDYSVLIRMENGGYTVPDVAVSASAEPDWYIFHKARWDLIDWWMKRYAFRSAKDFNRMWQEMIKLCPEGLLQWVKSRPVEVNSQ